MKNKEGKVLLNQIRTIDKQRLDGKKITFLDKEIMSQVDKALKIALALV